MELSYLPRGDRVPDRPVGGIEAAVEPDLQVDTGLVDRGQSPIHLGQVEREGFLAENGLSRPGGFNQHVNVRVGARADRYRVDRCVLQDITGRGCDRYPEPGTYRPGDGGDDVVDGRQGGALDTLVEQFGVHGADPACSQHCNP